MTDVGRWLPIFSRERAAPESESMGHHGGEVARGGNQRVACMGCLNADALERNSRMAQSHPCPRSLFRKSDLNCPTKRIFRALPR